MLWTWRFVCKSKVIVKIFGKLFMEPWQKYQILLPISTNQLWNPSTDIHQSWNTSADIYQSTYTVKGFIQFFETGLKPYKHNNGIMCSFDVCSLRFTTTWWNNTNLSRQAVRPSWFPSNTLSCFKKLLDFLPQRKAFLSSMVSITTRLMVLPWAHLWAPF